MPRTSTSSPTNQIQHFLELSDFRKSLAKLRAMGGPPKRRADKVLQLLGLVASRDPNPLRELPSTNHGESRIRGCKKFDLGDGYRLITVNDGIYCLFCFVGNHDKCDQWLTKNSGLRVNVNRTNTLSLVYQSGESADSLIHREPAASPGKALARLSETMQNELLENIPPAIIGRLHGIDETTNDIDIAKITETIMDVSQRKLVYDVMCLLLNGDISSAEARLDVEKERTKDISTFSETELLSIKDGDTVRHVVIGTKEHEKELERLSRDLPYHDWFMFMHPEQQKAVDEDFSGPAQLSGVSGSGKTCVAVKRAIRLAEQNDEVRVLVLTLNRSLAFLIDTLVNHTAQGSVVERIHVTSFFELCQDLLHEFEAENHKLYTDVAWKLEDHVDEVFREYYRCWLNNDEANVLHPIHLSLTSRGVAAETYIREEFDWIRSTVIGDRDEYLDAIRVGRKFPLSKEWRRFILQGLEGWERKMKAVGVIDYLGLTTAVSSHIDDIVPHYDHIVVDEAQDFGTAELAIVRRLVPSQKNDVFLCGDVAQHVLPKHRSLAEAGLETDGRKRNIVRNYRNSLEILRTAYEVFMENLDESLVDSTDLELLDPELASRSSPLPGVLRAQSLEEEIMYARSLVADHLESKREDRCCIVLAGYSMREVELFGREVGIPVLDGRTTEEGVGVVLSDLEQTKGYEFNLVIIVNCQNGILPPVETLKEEIFRHGCRLYVAMTRAKDELYFSYSGELSTWLLTARENFGFVSWADVVEARLEFSVGAPEHSTEFEAEGEQEFGELSGLEFIRTSAALGLSVEAQRRVVELVNGSERKLDGLAISWRNVGSFAKDLERSPRTRSFVGRSVQSELREAFGKVRLF